MMSRTLDSYQEIVRQTSLIHSFANFEFIFLLHKISWSSFPPLEVAINLISASSYKKGILQEFEKQ